jgi:F-type H+-transporting ATPase subunit b
MIGAHLPLWLDLLLKFVNFAVLAGAVIYFLRNPLKGYLGSRRQAVKEKIDEAERLLREAEGTKQAYEEKFAKLGAEIEAFRASVIEEVKNERKRIIDEAQALAGRIREQARLAYDQEMKEAMMKIQAEIADRTVSNAEEKVRSAFTKEDHDRLVEEFIQKVRSID